MYLSAKDKQAIVRTLKQEILMLQAVYLFGSQKDGSATASSDIDVAYLTPKPYSVILNLERASQATIDIATHIVKTRNLGLPNTSRELFDLLLYNAIISKDICKQMQSMVGFRNIVVLDYQNLNIEIVVAIVGKHLGDFEVFVKEVFSGYLDVS